MARMTGWWSRRSTAGKVELYTRWTFHSFVPVEFFALGVLPLTGSKGSPLDPAAATGMALWVLSHAVLCAVLASRALDHTTGRRSRPPVRLAIAVGSVTAAANVLVLALWKVGVLPDGGVDGAVVSGTTTFTVGVIVLCVDRVRHMLYVVVGAALATAAPLAVLGPRPAVAAGAAVAVFLGGTGIATACGFSSWLLGVVQELERSRELKARLAVAEERLRFGRDLHDVMGRNLSVIALKSELAVQLAQRGREEAVDQMVEVQRIARESQREVREVVRGYREADLAVELEGARGVLGAAGIVCEVTAPALDLPAGVQSALGWVVRETTTNVLRHGDARRCAIALRAEAGGVLLTVENDGVETAVPAVRNGSAAGAGSGLAGLRERLGAVDGTLDAGPSGPDGFRVTARVPLPRTTRRTTSRTASRTTANATNSGIQEERTP